jgi:hypothetical protein
MGQESETRQMSTPLWMCVDERFCTEFGVTVEQCIERYKNSMDEHVDVSTLTFYSLCQPYQVEVLYVLKEKKPMKS